MSLIKKYTFLLPFAFIALPSCHRQLAATSEASKYYTVSAQKEDTALAHMLQPYRQQMETQMSEVIGNTDTVLYKAQPECTLGNFIADAMYERGRRDNPGADASVMNYGGIRLSYIQPSAISIRTMYELMPFDNMLCIVEMNGKVLKQFCDHMAALKGWPAHGITYRISGDGKAIQVAINGVPVEDNRTYHIITNDYIATGGDNCSFLKPLKKTWTNIFIRDVLIDYVKSLNGKPLHPATQNRVSYE